jgi:hypothetical protein
MCSITVYRRNKVEYSHNTASNTPYIIGEKGIPKATNSNQLGYHIKTMTMKD